MKKGGKGVDDRKSLGRPQMYRSLSAAIDLQKVTVTAHRLPRSTNAPSTRASTIRAPTTTWACYTKISSSSTGAKKHLMASVGHPDFDMGANLTLGRIARSEDDLPEAARYLLQALHRADSLSVESGQASQLDDLYDAMQSSLNAEDPEGLRKIVENTLAFLTGPGWLENVRKVRATVDGDTATGRVESIAQWIRDEGTEQVVRALDRIDELVEQKLYTSAMEEAYLALRFAPNYLTLHAYGGRSHEEPAH